ncbi:MAG TPA: hypothetical protein VFN49_03710 [Candidatus Aquilonibacter sp.]|nr:hypothetical protein [Candidatus Aquilonibacter sp.]
MSFKLHRPTDPMQKAEVFGWDNPRIQAAIGATIQKQVGTSATLGPVIRQDLNPEVYEVFVKQFPLIDMIEKRESNGLVDAFERQLNYSQQSEDTPLTISETGTVVDDANSYVQDTCNIAVFASRRGASLKSVFGARAGGAAIDVAGREVAGGLLKIAHDFQTEAFRMQNVTATGAGSTTNLGVYDANGFKGFRYLTEFMSPATNIVTVDVTTAGGWTAASQTVTNALSEVVNTILDLGGNPDMCFGSLSSREYLRQEAYAKTTIFGTAGQRTEVIPGVYLPSFTLGNGEDMPYYGIPGKSVGSYSLGDGHTYQDIYIADTSTMGLVWLGAPTPTLIEVPLASDGTLRKLTIPYWMCSVEFGVPSYVGKVRLKVA